MGWEGEWPHPGINLRARSGGVPGRESAAQQGPGWRLLSLCPHHPWIPQQVAEAISLTSLGEEADPRNGVEA